MGDRASLALAAEAALRTGDIDLAVTGAAEPLRPPSEQIRETWSVTSWIVDVFAAGIRDSKTYRQTRCFLTSLRTTPEALLQWVRDRWSLEGGHWIRDTHLHERGPSLPGQRHRSNETLSTVPLNLLRLAGFPPIRAGMQAVTQDITTLLAMATRKPEPPPS